MISSKHSAVCILFGALASLCGCKGKDAPAAPPPVAAAVGTPAHEEVVEWDDYPARLDSPDIVNVSARVSGVIEHAPFQEGALVNAGDVLFIIDQRPFIAEVKSKEADLLKAGAQLNQADAHFKRFEKLKGTRAISAEDYDEAQAAVQQARSNVAVAEAALDISKLSLDWTNVKAPIAGKVSRKLVTEGNLITGGSAQATRLTTITSVDPLYCYANIPESAFLKYQQLRRAGSSAAVPAFIQLADEHEFGHEGVIDFVDNRVNPGTGTVEMRARIPNRDARLTPGLFARLRVPGSAVYKAVLIPDNAIGTNQDSKFVLIVRDDNSVEQRPIKHGALFGTLRAVTEGLTPHQRIVLTGIQQVRPGSKVNPQPGSFSTASLKPYLARPDPPTAPGALQAQPR